MPEPGAAVVAEDVLDRAAARAAGPPRLGQVRLVAVDGPSGSGKTVFAAALADRLRVDGIAVAVVPTDLLATWQQPLDWWPRWEHGLLVPLSKGRPGRLPAVRCADGVPHPGPDLTVPVPDVLIAEGVSAGCRAVADRTTALVWERVPGRARRLAREAARDGAAILPEPRRWQDMEAAHSDADRTADRADLIWSPPAD